MNTVTQTQKRKTSAILESHSISVLDYLSTRTSATVGEMSGDTQYWGVKQDAHYKHDTLMGLVKKGFVSVIPETSAASVGAMSYDTQRFEITPAGRFELAKYDILETIAPIVDPRDVISTMRRLAGELEASLRSTPNED